MIPVNRRETQAASLLSAVAGVPMVMAADAGPDAVLVAACAAHREAHRAHNQAEPPADNSPLVQAYLAAFVAVDSAPPPVTMAGVVALSRSALAEAQCLIGEPEDWEGPAGEWIAQAVKALIAIQGEAGA